MRYLTVLLAVALVTFLLWGGRTEPTAGGRLPLVGAVKAAPESHHADASRAAPVSGTPAPQPVRREVAAVDPRVTLLAVRRNALTREDEAAPGTRIRFGAGRSWSRYSWRREVIHRVVLGEALAGETGRVDIPLPALPAELRGVEDALLWAEVAQGGSLPSTTAVPWPADERRIELKIRVAPGGTIEGRVFTASGEPAPHGKVSLLVPDVEGVLRSADDASVAPDGTYRLSLREAAEGQLLAWGKGLGTASADGIAAGTGLEALQQDLHLRFGGHIRGRVVDPSGRPVKAYRVRALPADREGAQTPNLVESWPFALEGAGLYSASGATAGDGTFRLDGLRSGRYWLYGPPADFHQESQLLLDRPAEAGMEELVVVVGSYRFEIIVRDEAGFIRPAQWSSSSSGIYRSSDPWAVLAKSGAGDGPPVSVQVSGTRGGYALQTTLSSETKETPDGRLILFAEPDVRYQVSVVPPDSPVQEFELAIIEGQYRRRLEIEAPRGESGAVVIRPQYPDGSTYREKVRLRILSPETGQVLMGNSTIRWGRMEEQQWTATLGPGRYLLHAYPMARFGRHGERFGDEPYASRCVPFVAEAGRETELVVPFFEGGFVRLRVEARGEPDLEAWPASAVPYSYAGRLAAAYGAASVRFLDHRGQTWDPSFDLEEPSEESRFSRRPEVPWIRLGEERRDHNRVPLGEVRVLVQAPGYPPVDRTIRVDGDRENAITIALDSATGEPASEKGGSLRESAPGGR